MLLALDIKWRELWAACVFTCHVNWLHCCVQRFCGHPVSSSGNCVDCIIKNYKANFVKKSFTYIGSVWGSGKMSQSVHCSVHELTLIPVLLSNWYLIFIYITLHWIFGFLLKQSFTQMSQRVNMTFCKGLYFWVLMQAENTKASLSWLYIPLPQLLFWPPVQSQQLLMTSLSWISWVVKCPLTVPAGRWSIHDHIGSSYMVKVGMILTIPGTSAVPARQGTKDKQLFLLALVSNLPES